MRTAIVATVLPSWYEMEGCEVHDLDQDGGSSPGSPPT
jgi:hypothetical protein